MQRPDPFYTALAEVRRILTDFARITGNASAINIQELDPDKDAAFWDAATRPNRPAPFWK